MLDQNSSEEQLKSARQESERLRAENARLRAMLGTPDSAAEGNNPPEICLMKTPDSRAAEALTQERKVALFRSLFRGREDVYATRWERKDGQSGYSPAGVMDWRAIHAARPEERKKVARKTRVLQPLTDDMVRDHLVGPIAVTGRPASGGTENSKEFGFDLQVFDTEECRVCR